MNKYKVAVEWMMFSFIEVEAASMEEAISIVENEDSSLPDGDYLDDSFQVNTQITTEINRSLFD
jgi:hypothetical protein